MSAPVPQTPLEAAVASAILASDKEEFERLAKFRMPHNWWAVTEGMKGDAVRRARAAIAAVEAHV